MVKALIIHTAVDMEDSEEAHFACNTDLTVAHNDGECNAEMMKILREHSDQNFNNDDSAVITDNKIDPRWSNLKNLLNNN